MMNLSNYRSVKTSLERLETCMNHKFDNNIQTKGYDLKQVQIVKMFVYSDTNWEVPQPLNANIQERKETVLKPEMLKVVKREELFCILAKKRNENKADEERKEEC